MQTTERRVPLGPAQRNWLRYLQANPGLNYAELGKRSPKGRPVYALQAVPANGDRREP